MQRIAIRGLMCSAIYYLVACTTETKEQEPIHTPAVTNTVPFIIPSDLATRSTDIRRVDLRRTGYEDAVVMVYPRDSLGARIGFEELQIFEFDSTKRVFVRVHEEKVYYGVSLDVRDVDGDGIQEICIRTNGGGTSEIASIGLIILKKLGGRYMQIVSCDSGNPELLTLSDGNDAVSIVVVNTEFAPPYIARTEAVEVIDSVIVLNQSPTKSASVRLQLFDEYLSKAEQRYIRAKQVLANNRSDEAAYAVYSEVVTILRLMKQSSRSASLPAFVRTERLYWRSMLPLRYQKAIEDALLPSE